MRVGYPILLENHGLPHLSLKLNQLNHLQKMVFYRPSVLVNHKASSPLKKKKKIKPRY